VKSGYLAHRDCRGQRSAARTFNANTFSARGEGGYRFATPVVGITPYAVIQVTNISLPSYGEVAASGNNAFALNYAAQDTTIVRTELGVRFDRSFALQTAMLTLRDRAAWAHDEGNTRNVSAVFGALPGSNFTVDGAVPSKDLALLGASADLAWINNVTLSGMFEGQFSQKKDHRLRRQRDSSVSVVVPPHSRLSIPSPSPFLCSS
jgi:hypothetical protein